MNTKTYLPKENEIQRKWHLVDADGKVLGRLATRIADVLRGKDKAIYTSHIDCGDFVVVTNASRVVLTGKKLDQKIDFRHSGYPGGDRYTQYRKMMEDMPERVITLAIKGMLPKNKLAARQLKRLKVYRDTAHPHVAQFAVKKPKEAAATAVPETK
jgi:large subunit ribosomal protein L13